MTICRSIVGYLFILILLTGCGTGPQTIDAAALRPLTDAQVKTLLQETIRSGDASSSLFDNLAEQLATGKDSGRSDAEQFRNLIAEMIVFNEAEKNRKNAKEILEAW